MDSCWIESSTEVPVRGILNWTEWLAELSAQYETHSIRSIFGGFYESDVVLCRSKIRPTQ
jgi:hypothetical protein